MKDSEEEGIKNIMQGKDTANNAVSVLLCKKLT